MTGGLRGSDIMECIEEGPERFRGSKMKKCVCEDASEGDIISGKTLNVTDSELKPKLYASSS
jgi:hypothetical protein